MPPRIFRGIRGGIRRPHLEVECAIGNRGGVPGIKFLLDLVFQELPGLHHLLPRRGREELEAPERQDRASWWCPRNKISARSCLSGASSSSLPRRGSKWCRP